MNPLVEQFLNGLGEFDLDLGNGCDHECRRPDGRSLGAFLAEQDDAILADAIRIAMMAPSISESREQDDAILAEAIRCAGVFRNAIIEELLIVRHRERLIRLLLILGADEHTADNLVQDICVNVLQGALNTFDANREFGCYLRTMVRNLYCESLRGRQPAFTEDMLESPGPDTIDQEVEMHELLNRFEAAIGGLPEQDRSIMRMTSVGWQPREIANELGLVAGHIDYRLARCREHLIQLLAPALPAPTRGRPRLCRNADASDNPPDQS